MDLVAFVIQMFHCVWVIGAAIDPTDFANILFILLKYTQSEIKASFVVGRYSNETLTQIKIGLNKDRSMSATTIFHFKKTEIHREFR